MGFAHRNPDNMEGLAYIGSECKLGTGGYTCPRQGHPFPMLSAADSDAVSVITPCSRPLHTDALRCMSLQNPRPLLAAGCRCKARVVDLPCSCHVCGLTLISSPHLARSYHHLFPVRAFTEVPPAQLSTLQVRRNSCSSKGHLLWVVLPACM